MTTLYASDTQTGVNVKEQTLTMKSGQTVEVLVSDDGYIRITQPTKVNMSTFESKVNLMGETKQGTEITIAVYNKKASDSKYSETATTTYELNTVGVTGTFNQLIELSVGDNKIELSYANGKTDTKDVMVFYIKRESEESKELLKSYKVSPSVTANR